MSMYVVNPADFPIKAVHPSGIPQYQSGQATAQRSFVCKCHQAQELGLRALGKFYKEGEFEIPWLPAEFPVWDRASVIKQQMRLVATAFEIVPLSACCFNNFRVDSNVSPPQLKDQCIENLAAISTLERYYALDTTPSEGGSGIDEESECMCQVNVTYSERPWDCTYLDLPDAESESGYLLLENTAIATERSGGYELYTLPNRNLVWADVVDGPDKMLKGDTYATVMVPTADITVTWFNVPVKHLCAIETHLAKFRGTVNKEPFDLLTMCMCADPYVCEDGTDSTQSPSPGAASTDCSYEPETVMFMNWQEERSQRTRAFAPMDTTTLTLQFKQKRIVVDTNEDGQVDKICGWNHLLCDRETDTNAGSPWQRVKVKLPSEKDLFIRTDWKYLLRPTV